MQQRKKIPADKKVKKQPPVAPNQQQAPTQQLPQLPAQQAQPQEQVQSPQVVAGDQPVDNQPNSMSPTKSRKETTPLPAVTGGSKVPKKK